MKQGREIQNSFAVKALAGQGKMVMDLDCELSRLIYSG